ncbi:MAG: phosphoribosylaminoimidazolesuccinocarboxamide synthase [bacterium]|nr:phosphoribosylaminoimidazolesuccinocarboxamide synthase [Candidatus Sumerlaeota bacterium]
MTVYETNLPFPLISRGKVRDIYDLPEGLLLVATDRLSAFDVVFPDPIPRKGEVLTQLSGFWFERTQHIIKNHIISLAPRVVLDACPDMRGRAALCRCARPLTVECVVRGYLEGSAWTSYRESQSVCGIRLPAGLPRRARMPFPIFTPTTKAASGHDEPVTFEDVAREIGVEYAEFARQKSIELYSFAHDMLLPKGIIISDTKFEFGELDGELLLIDEALTPDSSRFWEADGYTGFGSARSLDKQYIRDYVESLAWSKKPPAPRLPDEVIANTTHRYTDIFERITGRTLDEMIGNAI